MEEGFERVVAALSGIAARQGDVRVGRVRGVGADGAGGEDHVDRDRRGRPLLPVVRGEPLGDPGPETLEARGDCRDPGAVRGVVLRPPVRPSVTVGVGARSVGSCVAAPVSTSGVKHGLLRTGEIDE